MVGQSIGLRWLFEQNKYYRSVSCYPGFLLKKGHIVTRTYFRSAIGKKQCQNSKPFISDFKYDRRLEVKIHFCIRHNEIRKRYELICSVEIRIIILKISINFFSVKSCWALKLTAPGLEEWTAKIQNGKTSAVKFSRQSNIE